MRRFHPVGTLPQALDIVWCRFPYNEMPEKPGPKARPGLIRANAVSRDGKKGAVQVIYGTSRIVGNPPRSLIIEDDIELAACGLKIATCFLFDTMKSLPWSEEFFPFGLLGTTCLIGHLPASATSRLTAATRR